MQDEEGSYTIESVIWFPIFAILLAFVMNISLVFFSESQMLRVVQDGNRALSMGRFETAEEVENYVQQQLAYLDADLVVDTQISGGFVSTNISVPASDLMPLNLMTSAFASVNVAVFVWSIERNGWEFAPTEINHSTGRHQFPSASPVKPRTTAYPESPGYTYPPGDQRWATRRRRSENYRRSNSKNACDDPCRILGNIKDNLLYWANCQGGGSFDEDEYSITGSDLQF